MTPQNILLQRNLWNLELQENGKWEMEREEGKVEESGMGRRVESRTEWDGSRMESARSQSDRQKEKQ